MSSPPSLKDKQIAALKRIVNLNVPLSGGGAGSCDLLAEPPVWKLLIFDSHGQDIISPTLSVKQLRDLGVTLHLRLHSVRQSVPDVPAVYLCSPSEENLARIHRDLSERLYDFYHFNFLAPISRAKLEQLAEAALLANCASNIKKVHDQFVHFVCLEEDMFVLRDNDSEKVSYCALNRSDVNEAEMNDIIDIIADGLFSVCVTMGTVPIIRCSRKNAAEMVARKLDTKLRENLRDARSTLFGGGGGALGDIFGAAAAGGGGGGGGVQYGPVSFQRPLLVLLDRNMDMATPLHHTWTYQALAHDVLQLKLNRVTVPAAPGAATGANRSTNNAVGAKGADKVYDLSDADPFWRSHKGSPFPVVAEAVQEELEKYKASEDQLKSLKQQMGDEGAAAGGGSESSHVTAVVQNTTSQLTSAVASLPQLLERKAQIDAHTTIATAILEEIKRRRLDTLFETEEKLLSRSCSSSSSSCDQQLLQLLSDTSLGNGEDALRLFLMHYVSSGVGAAGGGVGAAGGGAGVSEQDMERCLELLQQRGANLASYRYLKRWRLYNSSSGSGSQFQGSDTKTINMFSKLMSQGSYFVMENVKNLVVKKHNLPVTRVVDALMEHKSLPETDSFCYLDPKLLKASGAAAAAGGADTRSRAPFHEAIVFVVGGGNYIEYQNLVDYAKGKSSSNPRRIVYGSTDLQNASSFLKQLTVLGEGILQ